MPVLNYDRIKRLAIIAMVSDDRLMNLLVLKGGNALDLVYGVAERASIDLDFSIEREFDDLPAIAEKLRYAFERTFAAEGYRAFDVKIAERPAMVAPDLRDFWGGYVVEFKIIEQEKHGRLAGDLAALRRNAALVGAKQKRTFSVDVSKFEYCSPRQPVVFEGYTVLVYTPAMVVFEKLRAICQQMPEYAELVRSKSQSARARDFFDIYTVDQRYRIDFHDSENVALVRRVFAAKRVPLALIKDIHRYREYHRPDFAVVRDTVKPDVELQGFDFYFDHVLSRCAALEPLGDE